MPQPLTAIGRRRFARIAGVIFWVFAVCFGLGALQTVVAMRSNQFWIDALGHALSPASMRYQLIFLLVASVLCGLLAWHWHRLLQQDAGKAPPP
jgi:hypothetical protein